MRARANHFPSVLHFLVTPDLSNVNCRVWTLRAPGHQPWAAPRANPGLAVAPQGGYWDCGQTQMWILELQPNSDVFSQRTANFRGIAPAEIATLKFQKISHWLSEQFYYRYFGIPPCEDNQLLTMAVLWL